MLTSPNKCPYMHYVFNCATLFHWTSVPVCLQHHTPEAAGCGGTDQAATRGHRVSLQGGHWIHAQTTGGGMVHFAHWSKLFKSLQYIFSCCLIWLSQEDKPSQFFWSQGAVDGKDQGQKRKSQGQHDQQDRKKPGSINYHICQDGP